jgi:hypothetical protein
MKDVDRFFSPDDAASHLRISVPTLISVLKVGGYSFTSLSAGEKPWGRGRRSWGLTAAQLQAVMDGQTRQLPRPDAGKQAGQFGSETKGLPRVLPGWDGKSRVRKIKPLI